MVLFHENDPFHWGSLSRSMFTILRLETLDSWDKILYIAMFGCDEYPGSYPYLLHNPQSNCVEPGAKGWVAVLILFIIVILGAYVLPTILIGIVSIKFDAAHVKNDAFQEAVESKERVVDKAKEDLPHFFHANRVDAIVEVFEHLDANDEFGVDVHELSPFLYYVFDCLFNVELTSNDVEGLFHL